MTPKKEFYPFLYRKFHDTQVSHNVIPYLRVNTYFLGIVFSCNDIHIAFGIVLVTEHRHFRPMLKISWRNMGDYENSFFGLACCQRFVQPIKLSARIGRVADWINGFVMVIKAGIEDNESLRYVEVKA